MSSPGNKGQACLLPSLWRSFLSSVFLEGGTTHCVQSICLVSLPRGLHGTWGARGAGTHIQFMLPILLWVIDDLNPSGLLVSLPTKCVWLLRVDLTAAGCCLGTAWQHHLLLHPLHSPHFPALCWAWLLGTTPPAPPAFLASGFLVRNDQWEVLEELGDRKVGAFIPLALPLPLWLRLPLQIPLS